MYITGRKWSGVGTASVEVLIGGDADQLRRRRGHDLRHLVVEATGPVEGVVWPARVDPAQVVDHVAAADDQHAPFAQRRQLGTELEVILRAASWR